MTWLWVTLAVLVGLGLLTQLRVKASVAYNQQGFFLWVGVAGIWIRLVPSLRTGKQEGQPPKTKKPKKPKKAKPPKKKKTVEEWFHLIEQWVEVVLNTLGRLREQLHIEDFQLYVQVGDPDPAQAAIYYGGINAGLGMILALLEQAFIIQSKQVATDLNFDRTDILVDLSLDGSLTLGQAVVLVLLGLQEAWPLLSSKESKDPNQTNTLQSKELSL